MGAGRGSAWYKEQVQIYKDLDRVGTAWFSSAQSPEEGGCERQAVAGAGSLKPCRGVWTVTNGNEPLEVLKPTRGRREAGCLDSYSRGTTEAGLEGTRQEVGHLGFVVLRQPGSHQGGVRGV